MVASIKGIALRLAVDGLQRVMNAEKIRREEVVNRMKPEDAWVLDGEIVPGLWYPIDLCSRVIQLSLELENKGGEPYLRHVGTRVAEMFFSSEIYERFATAAEKHRESAGRLVINVPSLVLNFSKWTFRQEDGQGRSFFIEAEEAEAFSDVFRFLAEGFIRYIGERAVKAPVAVTSTRPAPDRILFHGEVAPS